MRNPQIRDPAKIDRAVNAALEHLADVVAVNSIISMLDSGAVATIALSAAALLHAQMREPGSSTAETPQETLAYAVPRLSTNARNAVGSIACAVINLQTELRRDAKSTLRDITSMLDSKPKRKR